MVVTMKSPSPLTFFLCLLLIACTPFSQTLITDCDILTAASLRALIQMDSLPPNPVEWIVATFNLDSSAIASSYGVAGASFNWNIAGIHYYLGISPNGIPNAMVQFQKAKPTVGRMLECLGPPERYRARYFFHPPGVNSLMFDMYYPSQGLVATYYQTTNWRRRQPPSITANTPIKLIQLNRPGSTFEDYMQRNSASPETVEIEISQTKPWPGSWEAIEIDLGPFLESN